MTWKVLMILCIGHHLTSTYGLCPNPVCRDNWNYNDLPFLTGGRGQCGRMCNQSRICDPCRIISTEIADRIDASISHVESTKTLCGKDHRQVYFGVALINKMRSGSDTDTAKSFATNLRKRWNLGPSSCDNDVIIIFSRIDRQIYTSVGLDAHKILKSKCIQEIYEDARDKYLKSDQFGEGILYMINEYKLVFEEGSCEDTIKVALIVIGSLFAVLFIVLVCCGLALLCPKSTGTSPGGSRHSRRPFSGSDFVWSSGGGGGGGFGGGGGGCGGGGGGGGGGG